MLVERKRFVHTRLLLTGQREGLENSKTKSGMCESVTAGKITEKYNKLKVRNY